MNKEKVAVIGLGAMGSVLAKLLIQNGQDVVLWNRSADKAKELAQQGATYFTDIHEAAGSASLLIICVKDYAATFELLNDVSLKDKTVVQLSTGTPQDARDLSDVVSKRGGLYLDGAILATPSQVGMPDTPIFLSGSTNAFSKSESALKILAGNLLFMGEAPGDASAWDLAVLVSMFGMMTTFMHGARIMETEGLKVSDLGDMIFNIAPVLGKMVQDTAHDIQEERFRHPQSSIDICAMSFGLMARNAKESGLDGTIPSFLLDFFNKGKDAGFGRDRISALIKTLRG